MSKRPKILWRAGLQDFEDSVTALEQWDDDRDEQIKGLENLVERIVINIESSKKQGISTSVSSDLLRYYLKQIEEGTFKIEELNDLD